MVLFSCVRVQPDMSYASAIEWTDTTWNPVRGCTKVSPGCRNCYAEVFAERWRGVPGHPYEFGFDLRLVPEKLVEPLTWSRPRKIFVNSMSDLFQDGVPDDFIVRAFEVMQVADWHAYQVLTKRPERMKNLVRSQLPALHDSRHIWLGVSVEDKKHGIPRIKHLQETPAAVRFLSIEPLLEDLGKIDLKGIHWVIVGGESGHGARPLKENWVNSILRQCRTMEVPFFFKQWGGVQKKKAGRTLNGRLYDEYPTAEFRRVPHHAERVRRLRLAQIQLT
jgi:protein gp37